MDNTNNNFENVEGGFTYPAPDDGASVQDTASYTQGKYPQPPEWTKNIVVSQTPWPAPGDEGNVSVQFNEPEKEDASSFKKEESDAVEEPGKEWPVWLQIGVVVLFAVIAFLLGRNVLQLRNSPEESASLTQNAAVSIPVSGTTIPTTVPVAPTSSDKTTSVKDNEKSTTVKEEKTSEEDNKTTSLPAAENKTDDEKSKKQVIEYFNESSNRVKTEAVKVVKNFENRTHNEDKLKLPSAIKGVGKSLLENKITNITEPTEYPSREAIIARYPVPGEEWSSKLTVDDVSKAACVEKGDEYEITLILNSCTDPEPGKGVSKAMDCLDVPTIRDTAPPFITAFSAEYYDCVIRCRVEKSTGRIVWSSYTTPVLIKVGLDAGFAKFDAEIGLTFEKDYSITY